MDSAGILGDTTATGTLMTVRPDGTGLRRVATFKAADGVPLWASWSPDGRHIVVQSGNYVRPRMEDKTADLWMVDVASRQVVKLAPHPERSYLNEAPDWFPDGSRIAFQSNRTGTLQVWTMKADGTDERQLTENRRKPAGHFGRSARSAMNYRQRTKSGDQSNETDSATHGTGTAP